MNKEDIIISLLKEIDENIDNVGSGDSNANLQELIVTANGEYLPDDYNVYGFSKVTVNVVPMNKVVIPNGMRVTNALIVDGYWAGELVDTGRMITMYEMFTSCSQLQNLDVSNWDVSGVTNMSNMFTSCSQLQNLDVSNWDVSNVTTMVGAFRDCASLQSIVGNRTMNDVLANNISALNGLKFALALDNTILDRASLRALINGLADLTGSDTKTLTLGETLIAKLTEEDIAIATAKNWTIA